MEVEHAPIGVVPIDAELTEAVIPRRLEAGGRAHLLVCSGPNLAVTSPYLQALGPEGKLEDPYAMSYKQEVSAFIIIKIKSYAGKIEANCSGIED